MWYNLPNKIQKDIIEPVKGIVSNSDYNKINKPTWFDLPNKISTTFDILVNKYKELTGNSYPIQKPKFIWYNLPRRANILCILVNEIIEILPNPLEITGTLPKEFSCIEGTDEIFIYGTGFTNTTNVIVDSRDVIDFQIVSDTVLKVTPIIFAPYPAIDVPIQINVIRGLETSNAFYLNITNEFNVAPIILSQNGTVLSNQPNAELSICSSSTGNVVTCNTAQGTWKTLDDVLEVDGAGNVTILRDGIGYIYYDITGSLECGRQYLRLNVVPEVVITSQPTNKARIENRTFTIPIHTENASTYQWQVSTDDGTTFTDLSNGGIYSGVTTEVLTLNNPTISESGYVYQCIITGIVPCSETISNSVVTIIGEEVGIVSDPSSVEVCQGADVVFSVEVEGNPVSYQWYEDTGLGGEAITNGGIYSGADTAELTINNVTTIMAGTNYYLEIRGATEVIQTTIVSLYVNNC